MSGFVSGLVAGFTSGFASGLGSGGVAASAPKYFRASSRWEVVAGSTISSGTVVTVAGMVYYWFGYVSAGPSVDAGGWDRVKRVLR